LIQMYGVSKVYPNGILALYDVDIHVHKGEFVFLVGPSGAGKSSLVKLVYREELPTEGSVFVAGKDVSKLRRREVAGLRRNIGVVFQDFKLLPRLTVYDNVAFAMRVVEATRREIARRVPAVLELVGLEGKERALPCELSGGEQQRASLARAIVNNPKVLIADEPTGNLDPGTAWEIVELMLRINRIGTTVLVATHEKWVVDRLKRRVVEIDEGRIVRDDPRGGYDR